MSYEANEHSKECYYEMRNAVIAMQPVASCSDAISRQAAIDAFSMFAEYESNRTNAEWVDRIRVVLSSLPSVTPNQVPCEDAISRQLVIKVIYDYNSLINIAQAVRELPHVQPIRSRGHWIFEEGDGKTCFDGYVCSACNKSFHTHVPYFAEYEFCPHCGADMRESEEQA